MITRIQEPPRTILAIDSATSTLGVAVCDFKTERSIVRCSPANSRSEVTLSLVHECLEELRLRPVELDGVICTTGPGSFTGLRVGMATAKGLCYALQRPLLLTSSLSALRSFVDRDDTAVLACTDAYHGYVYARLFLPNSSYGFSSPVLKESRWLPDELASALTSYTSPILHCGNGAIKYPIIITKKDRSMLIPQNEFTLNLAHIANNEFTSKPIQDIANAAPTYISN